MSSGSSGPVAVGSMTFGDHLCLAYGGDEERDAVLAAYVRGGMLAGHRFVHVADPAAGEPVRVPAAMEAAASLGHVVTAPIDGFLDAAAAEIERALELGYEGVRYTCETSYSRGGWPGTAPFAAYEEGCRRVFGRPGVRAMLLCQYDARWFGPEQLRHLDARHAARVRVDDVYDDGVLRITPIHSPPGLRLTGAIDESTLPAVELALAEIAGRGGHFCLDLGGLEFCDVAGLRALVGAGTARNGLERQVILRDAPACLHLIMQLAGWDSPPPGVYLEGATA